MKVSENLSITFLVEKPEMSKDGWVPIIVRVTLNGQRTEISLGARIYPDQWDKISSRVKGKSPDAMLLNSQITQTKAKLERHFFLLTTQHEFDTADMIRRSYKGKLVLPGNPDEPDEKKTFMQAVAFEITRLKEKQEKGLRAKSTITKWESTRTKLEAFLFHKYKKADIPMEIIRPNFAEDMLHYFMVEQELDHNTAMKYIRNTKQVLTTATGRWIKSNPIRDFRCSYKQPERDVLTIQDRPQHFSIESAPEDERQLTERNAYLLKFGITPIWFPNRSYRYIEQILRLARNELRYRGHVPGEKKEPILSPPQKIDKGFLANIKSFLNRHWI